MDPKRRETPKDELQFHGKQLLPENQPGRNGMRIMGVALGAAVLVFLVAAAVFLGLSPWS